MKKRSFLPLFLGFALLLSAAGIGAAQSKTVTVPKGTKVQKLGPGSFKLTAPDGTVFAITSYKKADQAEGAKGAIGIVGDCGIRDGKGKLIAVGAIGVLEGGIRSIIGDSGKALKDVPPADYVKIDDEVTWLPATIRFSSLRIFDRQALLKLSPQPDPPGKVR